MTETVVDYLENIGGEADTFYSHEEASQLVNENVIGIYKGRVKLVEIRNYTGVEIAEKLNTIHQSFEESFLEALEEDERENI